MGRTVVLSLMRDAAPRFDQYIDGVWPSVPEIQPYAPIDKLRNHGWNGACRQVPSLWKHHCVASSAEAAIEHQIIPIEAIACRCRVGFRDAEANRLTLFHGGKWNHHNL